MAVNVTCPCLVVGPQGCIADGRPPGGGSGPLTPSRCCLCCTQGIADGRVNLLGRMAPITDEAEVAAAKAEYLKKHPGSFWVEFGDFRSASCLL